MPQPRKVTPSSIGRRSTSQAKNNWSATSSEAKSAMSKRNRSLLQPQAAADDKLMTTEIQPRTFGWQVKDKVATITLKRPGRKNALTFESYAELLETFRSLPHAKEIRVVILIGASEDFCSGGDVHEIIGPLVEMRAEGESNKLL